LDAADAGRRLIGTGPRPSPGTQQRSEVERHLTAGLSRGRPIPRESPRDVVDAGTGPAWRAVPPVAAGI